MTETKKGEMIMLEAETTKGEKAFSTKAEGNAVKNPAPPPYKPPG